MKQMNKLFYMLMLITTTVLGSSRVNADPSDTTTTGRSILPSDVKLILPPGFSATVFADGLGKARHISITSSGYVYVKLASNKNGKTIVRLRDKNGDGISDEEIDFASFKGTGIMVKNGYLYASSDQEVYRFKLNADGTVLNPAQPERIITGLLQRGEHEAKAFTLDNSGNIYVNIGAYSNSCQIVDRSAGSPGINPCPILDSAGGIWQFRADKLNQTYANGTRYATGLRNVVGLDWNTATNTLFVMQHGRDQLHTIFPALFTDKQNAELPAECMYELHKGSNAGWPYIYYDPFQHKKILAPEYGGDGKKTGAPNAIDPVVAFPAHLAPNGLLFYTGSQFPAKYKNGAFIAFHGSWNRAPEPQEGFYVAFVPFSNGKPSGKWEIFANGFSGGTQNTASGGALHRPCGLAQGPDGSIYVTDDVKGTVWKITYK
ncbi:MAG: PQQ-dependent sugar dehydrogenase [Bacteroidota bacterium]|nr:PQQ-dependent sugar dehydrogenase [Bacteroidota bacterium]